MCLDQKEDDEPYDLQENIVLDLLEGRGRIRAEQKDEESCLSWLKKRLGVRKRRENMRLR